MKFTDHELQEMLKRVRHFESFSEQDRRTVIESGQVERHSKNEILFDEEGENSGLYVLLSGQIELCRFSASGQKALIAVLEPVCMFNEVAALDNAPNPVTAVAGRDATVWHITSQNLRSLLARYPSLTVGLLRVMAARNRRLVAQVQNLASHSVMGRTARLLLELSQDGQVPIDRRQNTNNQMAGRVATAPEAFSRALQTLRRQGWITSTGRTITVEAPGSLTEIAEGTRVI